LRITILCSDSNHPVNAYLEEWINVIAAFHDVRLVRSPSELSCGDFLFLVSCSELVPSQLLENYRYSLVLHASDLPEGRGWSPHIWDIVRGKQEITLCLLEAADKIDAGRIWLKIRVRVEKTALWCDINRLVFNAEIRLMNEAIENYLEIEPYSQPEDIEPSYYRKRTLEDSLVDPFQCIADQFDLIRVCDPNRYPAWFMLYGQKYKLALEKIEDE
jgi:methionyl-tRNA formyltransferase